MIVRVTWNGLWVVVWFVRKTLKKEGRAFQNIGKRNVVSDCKISLAFNFLFLYFQL